MNNPLMSQALQGALGASGGAGGLPPAEEAFPPAEMGAEGGEEPTPIEQAIQLLQQGDAEGALQVLMSLQQLIDGLPDDEDEALPADGPLPGEPPL
jgi:hypothetical protein